MNVRQVVSTFAVGAALAGPAPGQVIKMGTIAPEGHPMHGALVRMAQEWKELSRGRIDVRLYAGGVAGDETDMVRKMRIGQLQAAGLTLSSMSTVVPDAWVFSLPMLVETDEELDAAIEAVGDDIERRLEEKGFKVLAWTSAGWVHFFTKEPVVTPDDMRKHKLFFWGSDTQYLELIKNAGFNAVPLAVTDLLTSLQTGLVNAFAAPPTAALAFQWFALARNMTMLRWQPMPGVLVISTKVWDRFPEALQAELQASAERITREVHQKVQDLDQKAVMVMRNLGLKTHEVPEAVKADWEKMVREKGLPVFVGERISKDVYDRLRNAIREARDQESDAGSES
jgi:TRAP-type C4-dicarboxylate transport system substrate-binding protein